MTKIKIKNILFGLLVGIIIVLIGFFVYSKIVVNQRKVLDKENYACSVDSDCSAMPTGADDCWYVCEKKDLKKAIERSYGDMVQCSVNFGPTECACKKNVCQGKGIRGFFSF